MTFLDFHELQAFVVVAQTKSFSGAARRLHLTQPGISRRVARLERTLRIRLLDRSTRDVELTDSGEEFLRAAVRLLAIHGNVLAIAATLGEGDEADGLSETPAVVAASGG